MQEIIGCVGVWVRRAQEEKKAASRPKPTRRLSSCSQRIARCRRFPPQSRETNDSQVSPYTSFPHPLQDRRGRTVSFLPHRARPVERTQPGVSLTSLQSTVGVRRDCNRHPVSDSVAGSLGIPPFPKHQSIPESASRASAHGLAGVELVLEVATATPAMIPPAANAGRSHPPMPWCWPRTTWPLLKSKADRLADGGAVLAVQSR